MPRKKRYRTDHEDERIREMERIRERLRYSMREFAGAVEVPFRTYQKWVFGYQKPRRSAEVLIRSRALVSPSRQNCWEFLKCGREPGGTFVDLEGPCPAAVDGDGDGVNSGEHAGRICWAVCGTFCGERPQGTEASKLLSCLGCGFFTRVLQEEGLANFKLLKPGQTYDQI